MFTSLLFLLSQTASASEDYVLGSGDSVLVDVYDEPALKRDAPISSTCRIELSLIGTVEVCGRTAAQVQEEVQRRYADGYVNNALVVVEVSAYGSQRVEVRGSVKTPGLQVLQGPTTLSQLVTRAGGPSEENVVDVDLTTPDGVTNTYKIARLATQAPIYVHGNDVVTLRQGRQVFALGNVKTSGAIAYYEGITALDVLSRAGGPSEYGNLARCSILRADGTREEVNLRRVRLGKAAAPVLQPDDKLQVGGQVF